MTMMRMDTQKLKANVAKLKNVKVGIQMGDEVIVAEGVNYFNKMQRMAAVAYRDTKDYIKNRAETPTGLERGNPKGRYETGAMYRAFTMTPGGGTVTTPGKKRVKFYFEMGWLNSMPDYTLFQEYGTRNGIKAMEALQYGKRALDDFVIREHSRTKAEYARAVAEGWAVAMRTGKWTPRVNQPTRAWWGKSAVEEEDGE